ncbi:uncharacterized protein DEA37_0006264 [Paragonimus westermani]|uniref:Secreted protein n=1 Tax=Paragonimus westermani TaxID=34504 RepID=A0A5J4NC51_9TREM|nr:uncharacterized protein DEA37_0006264 [Paragonimus westermani]
MFHSLLSKVFCFLIAVNGRRFHEKPSTSSKNTGSSDNIPTFSDSVTPGLIGSVRKIERHLTRLPRLLLGNSSY